MHDDDIGLFIAHMRDPEARTMAAFTAEDPDDVAGEAARWVRIRNDPGNLTRTVLVDGLVAGHVASFFIEGDREITYWIGREWWGQGIATEALRRLLDLDPERPLHARVAEDNVGSLTVLERCGFRRTGRDRGYAAGRGHEIDELILQLDG